MRLIGEVPDDRLVEAAEEIVGVSKREAHPLDFVKPSSLRGACLFESVQQFADERCVLVVLQILALPRERLVTCTAECLAARATEELGEAAAIQSWSPRRLQPGAARMFAKWGKIVVTRSRDCPRVAPGRCCVHGTSASFL